MLDKHLIEALDHMIGFTHKGKLEVYHSILLNFCETRSHFSYEGMLARTELAVLDNSYNLGRQQANTSDGMGWYRVA